MGPHKTLRGDFKTLCIIIDYSVKTTPSYMLSQLLTTGRTGIFSLKDNRTADTLHVSGSIQ
jgi:hypothetical protein